MSTATETFSLKALIRQIADESALADPGALAKEVAKHVPDDRLRDCFDEMLRAYVQNFISHRSLSPSARSLAERPGDGSSGTPNRSWKVSGVRSHWRSFLRQRLHVGPGPTDWTFLGEASVEQLRFAAGERRDLAGANLANAERLEALAELCEEHEVDAPAGLADDVLAAFFGGSK